MKKNLILLLALVFGVVAFVGCSEDKLNSTSVIVDNPVKQNELDKWCQVNYLEPYNIDFHYRLNDVWTDIKYNVSPTSYINSIRMAKLTLFLCINAYDEVTGSKQFMRENFVKIIHLVGSGEYSTEGKILGTAEGGRMINLFDINYLPKVLYPEVNMVDLNYLFFHTMHHEFAHILHQTKPYSTDFAAVGSKYIGSEWGNLGTSSNGGIDPKALHRGFITAYASKAVDEDFAELVSVYITDTATQWEARLKAAEAIPTSKEEYERLDGRTPIEEKFEIVKDYMLNSWDLDLDALRAVILKRQGQIKDLDLEHLD